MRTVHERHFGWDNSIQPVVEIDDGDTLEFDVLDASGGQIKRSSVVEAVSSLDFERVNPVCGPVRVKGAQIGDVLEVEIRELRPGAWGWTGVIPGFGLLADEHPRPWLRISEIRDSVVHWSDRVRLSVRPFPGTIGVALAEPGKHSIVPPRHNGGNMDCKYLVTGAHLFLPVQVEGALFSVGDTHATQGDGEVCGTAIEAPMSVALRFRVHKGRSIERPEYSLPQGVAPAPDAKGYYVTTGISDDLMEAARQATRSIVRHTADRYALDPYEAYALASVAVDLRITEIVDVPNWVVSAFLPLSVVEDLGNR